MDVGAGEADRPLAPARRELNFRRSLVSEGSQMQARAAGALAQTCRVLDEVAATYGDLAERRTGRSEQSYWREQADRAASLAVRAQELRTALAAIPIELRPASSAVGDAP